MPKTEDAALKAAREIVPITRWDWKIGSDDIREQEQQRIAAIIRSAYAERDRVVRKALQATEEWTAKFPLSAAGNADKVAAEIVYSKVRAALAAMEE